MSAFIVICISLLFLQIIAIGVGISFILKGYRVAKGYPNYTDARLVNGHKISERVYSISAEYMKEDNSTEEVQLYTTPGHAYKITRNGGLLKVAFNKEMTECILADGVKKKTVFGIIMVLACVQLLFTTIPFTFAALMSLL